MSGAVFLGRWDGGGGSSGSKGSGGDGVDGPYRM